MVFSTYFQIFIGFLWFISLILINKYLLGYKKNTNKSLKLYNINKYKNAIDRELNESKRKKMSLMFKFMMFLMICFVLTLIFNLFQIITS